MNSSSLALKPQRLRAALASPKYRLVGALMLIVLVSLIGWRVWAATQLPAPYNAAKPVDAAALEAQWGIRITLVGASADGGLVDFRYIVIDPDKAMAMLDANKPVIIAEDSKTVISNSTSSEHRQALSPGQTQILLYLNARGAIKPGTPVTVVIGDVRLEHIIAR